MDERTNPAEAHLAQHAAYCRSLVASRTPELSERDLRQAYGRAEVVQSDSAMDEVLGLVVEALDEAMARLDRLEAGLSVDDLSVEHRAAA